MAETKYEELSNLIKQQNSLIGFQKYCYYSKENYLELFEIIRSCKVDDIKSRFNIWRITLKIIDIHSDWSQKLEQIINIRQKYQQKRQNAYNLINNLKKTDKQSPVKKNPLMKVMTKPDKVPVNQDQFLKEQIKKDVQRTYQEMDFFQQPLILKMLNTILFIWCKHNSDVSYKQGMNEILASIIFVYFQSACFNNFKPSDFYERPKQIQQSFIIMNSIQYADADIYSVFQKVMNIQKQMYKTQIDENRKGLVNPNSKNNTPILQRIIEIQDHKLKMLDLDLFRIIKLQDVQTKSFLLRWIRCMHTREFTLSNSFIIWDSIFLDYYESPTCKINSRFEFIDAMCLGMFIYMRSIVLSRQTSYQILQIYQKYPSLEKGQYLQQLITLAWSICEALRNQGNLGFNWYDQSKRAEKLQFLEKDSATQQIKSKQIQQKKKKQQQTQKQINQELKEIEKESNKIFIQKNRSQSKLDKVQTTELFVNKNQKKQINKMLEKQKRQFEIKINQNQWKQVENTLQKNIQQREDGEIKDLTIKVLKMLQQKVKRQQDKLAQEVQ